MPAVMGLVISLGFLLSGCNMTLVDSIAPLPEDMHAPVVAVTSFENRAGSEGHWKLGDGMADLLVSELVQSRNFVVVERQHFENISSEIERQQGNLFRSEGRTQPGHMKSAQYLIRGVINDFSQTGGGGFAVSFFRNLFLLGRGYTARVALTLTLVDLETGRAIYGGVKQITKDMPKNPWRPMISCVRNGTILVNGGKDREFKVNANYIVRGPAEPVTDPATGDIITYVPGTKLGMIQIIQVDDKVAYAKPVEGHEFNRGQWLMKATPQTKGP